MARPRTTQNRRRSPAAARAPQAKHQPQPRRRQSPRRPRMAPELKRLLWIVLSAMLVLGLLVYPFERRVVPEWSVQVVDENDHPVAGIGVQQEWGQFGPKHMIWADAQVSGVDGWVEFPERVVQMRLGPAALKYFLTSGLQPPDGKDQQIPAARLFVCQQGKSGEISWERGEGAPQGRLVVHRGFCQYSADGA